MARKFQKHHAEQLDGNPGAWRGTLVATMYDGNGDPIAWAEGVVVCCPSCQCQFGVGFDVGGPKIVNGVTDRPVRCVNQKCSWTDVMEFDKIQDAEGREHFNKLKANAEKDVAAGRVRKVKKLLLADLNTRLDEIAMAEAQRLIGNGDAPDAPDKVAQFIRNGGKFNK